jgi:hypothetical protein
VWRRSSTATAVMWHHGGLESRPHEPRSGPRQQWCGAMTVGLDLGLMGLDLGSRVFLFMKIDF